MEVVVGQGYFAAYVDLGGVGVGHCPTCGEGSCYLPPCCFSGPVVGKSKLAVFSHIGFYITTTQ